MAAALLLAPACGRLGYDVEADAGGMTPILTDAASPAPPAACRNHPPGNAYGTVEFRGSSTRLKVICGADAGPKNPPNGNAPPPSN